jgi:hypothetical protein
MNPRGCVTLKLGRPRLTVQHSTVCAVWRVVLCCRQLKVLRLGWNMLGVKSAKALAEGLKYCSSGLEQLYLPWSGITDTGASHIAKVKDRCLISSQGLELTAEGRGARLQESVPAGTCMRSPHAAQADVESCCCRR